MIVRPNAKKTAHFFTKVITICFIIESIECRFLVISDCLQNSKNLLTNNAIRYEGINTTPIIFVKQHLPKVNPHSKSIFDDVSKIDFNIRKTANKKTGINKFSLITVKSNEKLNGIKEINKTTYNDSLLLKNSLHKNQTGKTISDEIKAFISLIIL